MIVAYQPLMAMDLRKENKRTAFIRARKVETQYARLLRQVARHIGDLVKGLLDPSDPVAAARVIEGALNDYSDTISGWARAVGQRMFTEVAQRDYLDWLSVSREMGVQLKHDIANTPVGELMRRRLDDQVGLITSLPRDAAQRVHDMTLKGITEGRRANEIADEIMRTGEVTRARANLIARTEVGRTSTELTRARAESIGCVGYVWRTAKDRDVRPSHRAMEGRFVAWNEAPELDGMKGHAGALPNCRCYVEPVIPGV